MRDIFHKIDSGWNDISVLVTAKPHRRS